MTNDNKVLIAIALVWIALEGLYVLVVNKPIMNGCEVVDPYEIY